MSVSCGSLMYGWSRSLAAQSQSGSDEPLVINSYFSLKCSNSMLRVHLESKHMMHYIAKLKEEGWQVRSPLLRTAFSAGHSYRTLKAALAHSNITINNLPPPPF